MYPRTCIWCYLSGPPKTRTALFCDQHPLDSITAVEGVRRRHREAFGTAKLSKPASTDIMSIAKDVSKPSTSRNSWKWYGP
jgi:hypothetical protein